VAHPGLYLAGPGFREGEVGRLEGLTDIRESRLDTVNLRSVCRAEHEGVNDFHGARSPLIGLLALYCQEVTQSNGGRGRQGKRLQKVDDGLTIGLSVCDQDAVATADEGNQGGGRQAGMEIFGFPKRDLRVRSAVQDQGWSRDILQT